MTLYRCISADPPWRFRDVGSRIAPEHVGTRGMFYGTLSVEQICALGAELLPGIVADDAHLWLWIPNALLLEGIARRVCEAWGFTPKQILTWCKIGRNGQTRIGFGHWMRNSTEQCVFAVRGRLAPVARNVPSHIIAPVTAHSAKPDVSYRHIEAVSPGPRLELFARRAMPGWHSWGNEAPAETRVSL